MSAARAWPFGAGAAAVLLWAALNGAEAQPSPAPKPLPAQITLPSELVTEIAVYLQDRPYREVAGLLGALQQAIAEQTRHSSEQTTPAGPPADHANEEPAVRR